MSSVNVAVLNALCNAILPQKSETVVVQPLKRFDRIIKNLSFLQHLMLKDLKTIEQKQLSKADIIREQNTEKNIIIVCEWLRKQYNSQSLNPTVYNGMFHEARLISMVIWAIKISANTNAVEEYTKYDCLMSLVKAMNTFDISTNITATNIDNVCHVVYNSLVKFCSVERLFTMYSELIVTNTFTKLYPNNTIKPYPAQQEIINVVTKSLKCDVPLFVQYSTETGSGKTYLSLALAHAHKAATSVQDRSKTAYIFTCYNETVRRLIWELSNACSIPACKVDKDGYREYKKKDLPQRVPGLFTLNQSAINDKSVVGSGGNVRSRVVAGESLIKKAWEAFDRLSSEGSTYADNIHKQYNFLLSCDSKTSFLAAFPALFICDPASAEALVKFLPNSTVFADETDVDDKDLAQYYANIVMNCPKRLIVASATVDDMSSEMNKFKEIWANRNYPDAITGIVRAGTSGIHSTLTSNGEIYLPHMFVDTDEEQYQNFLHQLRVSSIIKLYSPLAIAKMLRNIEMIDKLEQINLRELTYDSLRHFIIKFFTEIDLKTRILLKNQRLPWVKIEKPLTSDSHYLSGQTLSININPFNQASKWEDGLFNLMSGSVYDLAESHKTFATELKNYNSVLEHIVKNNTSKNSFRNGESWESVEHKIAEHSQTMPSLYFPAESIIGSVLHCKRFAKHAMISAAARIVNVNDGLYLNSNFELLQWLMAGVGFYDASLHQSYIDEVLNDVSDHILAMFISSPALIRGMDYRFENIFLNHDFLRSASNSAVKQAIGRVGRPGSSWGLIVMDDLKAVEKLLNPHASHEMSFFKANLQQFVNRVEKKIEVKQVEKFTIVKPKPAEPVKVEHVPDSWED